MFEETETVTIICEDGIEREFELILIFDHKEKTYGIMRQKLHGHWEMDGEVFLVDSDEEGAEDNFIIMEITNPDKYLELFEFQFVHPDLAKEIADKADEILDGDDDYYSEDDDMPF